jgi:predicted PurR-regulated permease PerM
MSESGRLPLPGPVPDSEQSGRRRKRAVFLVVSAALFLAVVVAAREVMLPFILAFVIAFVLTPLVAAVERRNVSGGLAVLVVYATVLGALGGFGAVVAPRIAHEFRTLRGELPTLAADARDRWVPAVTAEMRAVGIAPDTPPPAEEPAPQPTGAFVARPQADGSIAIDVGQGVNVVSTKGGWRIEPNGEKKDSVFDANRLVSEAIGRTFAYAQANSLQLVLAVRDFVGMVSRGVFIFFITLMLAAYLILTRDTIRLFFRSLVEPDGGPGFDVLLDRTDRGLAGVVRGQLLICGINGLLSAIGFAIVGLKYWPVMALVGAVMSLVPIFGSIASAVPAIAVALTQGLGTAVFVLFWILGIHQLEANVLNPKIMGDAAKIHPVLVIFSLLVGEHFFRVPGALLAVPCMSIAQSVFLHVEASMRGAPPAQ